jgi:hypothetical protein
MKTFAKDLMEQLKLQQSMAYPSILSKVKNNKVVLILAIFVEFRMNGK